MTFEPFKLHPDINTAIRDQGYTSPTPIQTQAIPPIMDGRDVLGLAQTGTGKTAAFVLPLLHQLMNGPRRKVRALVLAPTRELAAQTDAAIRALGCHTTLRSTVIFGGVNIQPQVTALKRGTEIVVACPGRLLDHIAQRHIDLSGLETLVIDEADRMFDMGFLPDIRRITKHLPPRRQNLLFSATMPDDIRRLAADMLREAVTVQIDYTKPLTTIAHALYPVEQHLKTALLRELLQHTPTDAVIVFTRTKHRAKRVAQQLQVAGIRSACLQGNLSQNQRQQAIEGFRNGAYQVLVATDIAARGIDVSSVTHVINYDIPDTVDAYTHRIGRTGRISRSGEAFTFITREDAAMVGAIERTLGESLVRRTVPGFNYAQPKVSADLPQPRTPAMRTPSPTAQPPRRGPETRARRDPAHRRSNTTSRSTPR